MMGRMSTARASENPDVIITHPNRETREAQATRTLEIALLILSAVLLVIITIGSWGAQAGGIGLQLLFGVLFAYFAKLVINWRSGVLPIAAGTAIVAGIFAAVAAGGWFERTGNGYESPALPEALIGTLIVGFALLQLALAVVSMRAFQQQWQVELEVPRQQAQHS